MKLTVKEADSCVQGRLFELLPDKEFSGVGERRARFGKIAERMAEALFPITPIRNTGNYDVVFDAAWGSTFIEVKNVRMGSSIPIYRWRSHKDMQVVGSGREVVYLVTMHRCKSPDTLGDAWTQMASTVRDVYAIPASAIAEAVKGSKVYKVVKENPGSRTGYERKGYCDGYQLLKTSEIMNMPLLATAPRLRAEVNGLTLSVKYRRHSHLRGKLILR